MAISRNNFTHNILVHIALICSILHTSFALFSQTTRWGAVSIQKNSQGTWCYLPVANAVRQVACNGANSLATTDFASVLSVHLNQGLSIAYYNAIDNTFLGGADYSLPVGANMPTIRLCVSGRAGDGYYYETICLNAAADNVLGNLPYCQVALGQKHVEDGCYEPGAVLAPSNTSGLPSSTSGLPFSTSGYPRTPTNSIIYATVTTTRYSSSAIPLQFSITHWTVGVVVVGLGTLYF